MKLKEFSKMLHKMRSVESKMTKEFEDSTGFSLTRYEILVFLKDNGDALQAEIAAHLDIDPAAITRHLKILEEKGYVNRLRNSKNAREIIVSCTDFTRAELEKCSRKQQEKPYELPINLSEGELKRLMDTLQMVEEKLREV